MKEIKENIVGQKIVKVVYSEVNDHEGSFYFDGFDTFDHAINIQMENGYCWNLGWKNDEYFEFDEGFFKKNKYIKEEEIITWEATNRWIKVLNSKVSDFNAIYIDEAGLIIKRIIIDFENKEKVNILISSALNQTKTIPSPLDYEFGGEIYVIHEESLLLSN
ncbi:hypothetical protein F7018_06690 [Tenacibaculum aiptasiae]|uniref:Uncharacterized protein n=1 Tax=Tenacibaculum aiptasiae TaxID=426481 RepID=A0A7J5AQU7_9FLAO|nr:hypothetical protein [Tenacibaculum aiptasiae]KAB1159995.1 hypothetical protein F7018_06690 [Tenacibaculum aiptasiae]